MKVTLPARWNHRRDGHRGKMLSLTCEGEAAFARWMVEPVQRPRQFRQEFLAKLFFASKAGAETLRTLLACQRDASSLLMDDLQRQVDAVPNDRPYDRQVYRLRAVQTEAHLRWLDECERDLASAAVAGV